MNKNTAVNIEKSKSTITTDALHEALVSASTMAINLGLSKTGMIKILEDAYKEAKRTCIVHPDELPTEVAFREKAEKFFELQKVAGVPDVLYSPFNDYQTMRGYNLDYCNYHIEVICAAYKLISSNEPIDEDEVFKLARDRMCTNEKYPRPKGVVWPRLRGRRNYVSALRIYYNYLVNGIFNANREIEIACDKSMQKYKLSKYGREMFKMIFVINNFDC